MNQSPSATLESYQDPAFLRDQIASIMDFYHPRCIDGERGGYINQLTDDGSVFDRDTKHLVGTCRFIFNYSLASRVLGRKDYLQHAAHGIEYLTSGHRQPDGGFAWVMDANGVSDGTRHCYGHAFVLLAASAAAREKVPGAAQLIEEIDLILEHRFWDPEARLYVDEIAADDWSKVDPYRGQNANMHMCEALLWTYMATDETRFLDRSAELARRICVNLANETHALVWEHYTHDWQPDWEYNRHDPKHLFRPYGFVSGHQTEWAKLLLALEFHRREDWMLEAAERLFNSAVEKCWDHEKDGMHYTFSPEGEILDQDRYYWVIAESAAAAAALAVRSGKESYWDWYDKIWSYADRFFIDHEHGGWYRVLDTDGNRFDDKKSPPAKTDYHPLSACAEILVWLDRLAGQDAGTK